MNFLWLLELRKYYWSLAILKKSRILQNRRKYGQIFTFSRLPNAPIFSLPNSATESFVVTDGSKEPKWKSTHHYLDAFFVFRFFKFFWSTKIWRIFCHRNKICGSTELRNASRSHFRIHHTDSRHKFRFVRGATIVLGSSKQIGYLPSASIRCPNRGFQFLRCFFPKKRGLRCLFPKPYFTFLDVISPYFEVRIGFWQRSESRKSVHGNCQRELLTPRT